LYPTVKFLFINYLNTFKDNNIFLTDIQIIINNNYLYNIINQTKYDKQHYRNRAFTLVDDYRQLFT
jgi:hypothetical protein